MLFAEELRASLEGLFSSGCIEIRERGGRTTPQPPLSWEVRGAADKPLLHLWAENCNVTRRVVAIADQSEERVMLAVERFGRTAPEQMEIVRLDFKRSPKALSRQDFCDQLRRVLAENFPDETLEKLSTAADLEHSLSGIYARGILRKGQMRSAFLAVRNEEAPEAIEGSLTFALLWLERCRQSAGKRTVSCLRLILPERKSGLLAHQLASLDPRVTIRIYELNSLHEHLEPVDPRLDGNVNTWLVPRRESDALLQRAEKDLAKIVALAPEAIRIHPASHDNEVVLRFRGLPFARWTNAKIHFWTGSAWREWNERSERELQKLLSRLKNLRGLAASDTGHPLYRAHAERWMQALMMQDIGKVDFNLDPNHVYEQVFAKSHGQHGVLDLLAATKTKRLAILELKATEDPELPLQAADYWARIRRHQIQGDLQQYGYFAGLQLQSAPPLLYLVAPALRFHPTTGTILRYLSPDIEIVRLGLPENWRRGLRVVMRQ